MPHIEEVDSTEYDDEIIVVEEKSADAKEIINTFLSRISQNPSTRQLLTGAASGWFTGIITSRIGRSIAFAIGGSIILLQVANSQGYVNLDWNRLGARAIACTERVKVPMSVPEETRGVVAKIKDFAGKNSTFTAAFVGGFFIGIAT